jgi:hypothetical protein
MNRVMALGLCGWLLAACGTTGAGRPPARPQAARTVDNTRAQAPAPAKSPEMNPANVEHRFGTAEDRARKQEAKRKKQDEQKRIDVNPPASTTP